VSLEILASLDMDFNIDELVRPNMIEDKEFAGTVVAMPDPQDSMGRIKVRIEPLFGDEATGIPTEDLPWISMGGDTNVHTKPVVGDIVVVRFRGTIYEGFYSYAYISANKLDKLKLKTLPTPSDLGSGFELSLDKIAIYGTYDGNNFDIFTPNFTLSIDNQAQTATLQGKGQVTISGSLTVINSGTAPVLNTQTLCQYSGLPHVSLVPNILVG